MFEFRLINITDGNQIIDRNLKTPYDSLTPLQMIEYMEMDNRLVYMERLERKSRKEAERQRKRARNLFYRLACACGIL